MKKILFIPVWFPSKSNPVAGIFFKEQAELLSEDFDISVLKINYKFCLSISYFLKKIIKKNVTIKKNDYFDSLDVNEADVLIPLELFVLDHLYSLFAKYTKKIDGVGLYHTKLYMKLFEKCMKFVHKKINSDYDVVYGISAQGIAYQAYLLSKMANKPLVLGEHGPFPFPGTTLSNTEKMSLENADCFFAISNDKIRQILLQNVKLQKICYVGNLVDETLFKYEPIEHSHKTFLIVAAYSFYKNYDMFIDTMNLLYKKATKEFRIIIAGYAANKGYSKNEDILEKKIATSKFSNCVEMIKFIPRDKMKDLYNRVDAFVMTSIQEGQPVSALEAACCGLPIFTTRCGGVEDYVTDEIGRVVNVTDSEQLSNYLYDFLEEKITFDSAVIRNTIVEKFGKEAFRDVMKKNIVSCD